MIGKNVEYFLNLRKGRGLSKQNRIANNHIKEDRKSSKEEKALVTGTTWPLPNHMESQAENSRSPLEMGWDLGPFTRALEPGQTSPETTEYKETVRD